MILAFASPLGEQNYRSSFFSSPIWSLGLYGAVWRRGRGRGGRWRCSRLRSARLGWARDGRLRWMGLREVDEVELMGRLVKAGDGDGWLVIGELIIFWAVSGV